MIREATDRDLSVLSNFAVELFGDTLEVQTDEIKILLQSKDAHFFLYFENDIPIGFAQVQLRYDYVEGTSSSPVGYLESIFVEKAYRKKAVPRHFCLLARLGQRKKAVQNLQATVKLITKQAYGFTVQ